MQQKNERSLQGSSPISRDYVRGFFDGDGFIYVTQKQIIITNTNHDLLQKIAHFLRSMNIRYIIEFHLRKNSSLGSSVLKITEDCYRLRVFGYYNLKRFFDFIGSSYADTLRNLRIMINSHKRILPSRSGNEQIMKPRKQWITLSEIAEIMVRRIGIEF
ncbi:MAG: LAGLIDADG family homing endonuclease [Candidatus Bathyarchaeia archaeon]